jgi:hypothetical protein
MRLNRDPRRLLVFGRCRAVETFGMMEHRQTPGWIHMQYVRMFDEMHVRDAVT